ncbi:MAG: hydroxymethylbilane synthase [Chloroflexi bacterium]|nr:hydroxymethylbilane synthase [Chloroflexota bacterium]
MTSPQRLRLGTRTSPLALAQSEEVLATLRAAHPGIEFEVVRITTHGDRDQTTPLADIGRGLFVKELESALLEGKIDFAVHSAKDLPTEVPAGLGIAAFTERADPRDVLVNKWHKTLIELPKGARIGTSSPRRTALLKTMRPDLELLPIRGNVGTRLQKTRGEQYDGAVLAAAGLMRLGLLDEAADYLDPELFIPDAGQGALLVETRADDAETVEILSAANHTETALAVRSERAFVYAMGGGCTAPVAAYVWVEGTWLHMVAFAAKPDGSEMFRTRLTAEAANPEAAGERLAEKLLDAGAEAVVDAAERLV